MQGERKLGELGFQKPQGERAPQPGVSETQLFQGFATYVLLYLPELILRKYKIPPIVHIF